MTSREKCVDKEQLDFLESLMRITEVERGTGLKRSTIYQLIQRGSFPKPVKLGPRVSVWVSSEIQAWIADRIAERDREERS